MFKCLWQSRTSEFFGRIYVEFPGGSPAPGIISLHKSAATIREDQIQKTRWGNGAEQRKLSEKLPDSLFETNTVMCGDWKTTSHACCKAINDAKGQQSCRATPHHVNQTGYFVCMRWAFVAVMCKCECECVGGCLLTFDSQVP